MRDVAKQGEGNWFVTVLYIYVCGSEMFRAMIWFHSLNKIVVGENYGVHGQPLHLDFG